MAVGRVTAGILPRAKRGEEHAGETRVVCASDSTRWLGILDILECIFIPGLPFFAQRLLVTFY
jgi:hypothetical protein